MNEELKNKILLDKINTELNYGNELITNADEFAVYVMQWMDAINKVFLGIEPLPNAWLEEYLENHPNENPGLK